LQKAVQLSILLQLKTVVMKQIISSRAATIIYGLAIACFGILHFTTANQLKTLMPDYIPGGPLLIYFTGACLLLAAIAIIFNVKTKLACYLLALMLLIFGLTIHMRESLTTTFSLVLKNVAMAMGAIIIGNNSSK
jgi:putative oxidoreductase